MEDRRSVFKILIFEICHRFEKTKNSLYVAEQLLCQTSKRCLNTIFLLHKSKQKALFRY